jgi:hypothetical protein
MKLKVVAMMAVLLCQSHVFAAGSEASEASVNLSAEGSGHIVNGSANIIQGGAKLTVASIQTIHNATYITLRLVGESVTTTIQVSSQLVGHASLFVGQAVQVSTTLVGNFLIASGQVLAFLPNEIGRSLVYNQII